MTLPSLHEIGVRQLEERYSGLQRKGFRKAVRQLRAHDHTLVEAFNDHVRVVPDAFLVGDRKLVVFEVEDSNPMDRAKLEKTSESPRWCSTETVSLWEISERPGLPPARLPGSLTSCSTTCVALRPETWCARVSPSASRWR
jgi:hypothetical protein